jgi:hypothetical protein
MQSID